MKGDEISNEIDFKENQSVSSSFALLCIHECPGGEEAT